MTNDVLASCADDQRVFLLYEQKLKMQFSRKGRP